MPPASPPARPRPHPSASSSAAPASSWLSLPPSAAAGPAARAQAHTIYASVARHLRHLVPARHPRDPTPFLALHVLALCPGPAADAQCFAKAAEPGSLPAVEHKIARQAYASPAAFEQDMMRLLANARLVNPLGSPGYGQVARVQRAYHELVAWPAESTHEAIEAHMDAVSHLFSLEPMPFASVPVGPAEGAQHACTAQRDVSGVAPALAQATLDLLPTSTADLVSHARLHTREKVVLDHIEYKGQTYRVGDWVHVLNPSNPSKPIVGQIFQTLGKATPGTPGAAPGVPGEAGSSPSSSSSEHRRGSQYYVSICWYHRPEETVHPPSRRFLPNEVFKTGLVVDHKIQDVLEKCFVMFYTRFVRGRPTSSVWDPLTQQLYVTEFRYNDQTRQFNKIKSWNSCLPEEMRGIDVPMDSFPKPVAPTRQPSPFVTGQADGPGFLCDEPGENDGFILGAAAARPGAGAPGPVHLKRPATDPLDSGNPKRQHRAPSLPRPIPPPLFLPGSLPSPISPGMMMIGAGSPQTNQWLPFQTPLASPTSILPPQRPDQIRSSCSAGMTPESAGTTGLLVPPLMFTSPWKSTVTGIATTTNFSAYTKSRSHTEPELLLPAAGWKSTNDQPAPAPVPAPALAPAPSLAVARQNSAPDATAAARLYSPLVLAPPLDITEPTSPSALDRCTSVDWAFSASAGMSPAMAAEGPGVPGAVGPLDALTESPASLAYDSSLTSPSGAAEPVTPSPQLTPGSPLSFSAAHVPPRPPPSSGVLGASVFGSLERLLPRSSQSVMCAPSYTGRDDGTLARARDVGRALKRHRHRAGSSPLYFPALGGTASDSMTGYPYESLAMMPPPPHPVRETVGAHELEMNDHRYSLAGATSTAREAAGDAGSLARSGGRAEHDRLTSESASVSPPPSCSTLAPSASQYCGGGRHVHDDKAGTDEDASAPSAGIPLSPLERFFPLPGIEEKRFGGEPGDAGAGSDADDAKFSPMERTLVLPSIIMG